MSADLQGLHEFAEFVQSVNDGLDSKLVRKPVTAGLRLLVRSMKAKAPRGSRKRRTDKRRRPGRKRGKRVVGKGRPPRTPKAKRKGKRLYQAHGFRFRGAKKIVAKAGVNVAKKRAQRAPHAHLLGLGTKERETKAGKKRGRITARPWVPDAVLAVADEALEIVAEGIWSAVAGEAARVGGKS